MTVFYVREMSRIFEMAGLDENLSPSEPDAPTSPKITRARCFRRRASGQTLSRQHCRSIIKPGSRGYGCKTVSGRHEWPSKDPIGFDGGNNWYAYCGNEPVNGIDPLGLWGIQSGNFNIGYGNPNLAFDSSSWNDLQQGASATTDGLLTVLTANGGNIGFGQLFNPNIFRNNYDPCDSILQWSHGLGEFAGSLLTIYAGAPQGSLFGDTQLVTHFGSDTLEAGNWVMTGPPSLRNWVMSGMNNAPWDYVTTTVSRSALSPAANEAGPIISTVKTAIGQRIYLP